MLRSLVARLRGFGDAGESPTDDANVADGGDESEDGVENGDGEESGALDADSTDTNDVWDLIPSRDYDGKYVESGGHSRGEQERALEDIQRQAAEIERSEDAEEAAADR